jgi:hypothetical protein
MWSASGVMALAATLEFDECIHLKASLLVRGSMNSDIEGSMRGFK